MATSDLDKILRLNRHALDNLGQLKPIAVQYGDYSFIKETQGVKKSGEYLPLILVMNCGIYGIPELADKPLVLFNHSIKHIEKKHSESIEDIASLADDLAENLLVFQEPHYDDKYIFVLRFTDKLGKRYIATLNTNITHDTIEINSVTSVHKKEELVEHIAETIERGKKIYVNERTGDWLNSSEEWELVPEDKISLTKAVRNHLLDLYCTAFPEKADRLPKIGSIQNSIEKNELDPRTHAELGNTGFAQINDEAKETPEQDFDNPFAKTANVQGDAATPAEQERAKAAAKAQGKVLPGYQRMRGMGRDA